MYETGDTNFLSPDQQLSLMTHAKELEVWLKRLAISANELYGEDAAEYSRQHPTQICSLLDERTFPSYGKAVGLDGLLMPAYIEDAVKYFAFTNTYDIKPDDVFPYLYVFFECEQCGDSEMRGEGCDNCSNGEIMFELTWDEAGKVTPNKTL